MSRSPQHEPRSALLHNMSQPPDTRVVVAPGKVRQRRIRLGFPEALLHRWGKRPTVLCRRLGIPWERGRAEEAIAAHTGALLDAIDFPRVVPLLTPTEVTDPLAPWVSEDLPADLLLAIVSRCGGRLFLRHRSPVLANRTLRARWETNDPRVQEALHRHRLALREST